MTPPIAFQVDLVSILKAIFSENAKQNSLVLSFLLMFFIRAIMDALRHSFNSTASIAFSMHRNALCLTRIGNLPTPIYDDISGGYKLLIAPTGCGHATPCPSTKHANFSPSTFVFSRLPCPRDFVFIN